jgi:hypothetical protein
MLPLPLQQFLKARLEAALANPARRDLLVWPMILGAPRLRELHPEGMPEPLLLAKAAGPLAAVGGGDPAAAWRACLERLPDTAEPGATGWLPHRSWAAQGRLLSLRSGVTLLVLTGLPADDRYLFAAAVALFNACLFHECHDALEPLWSAAEGDLKRHLQGLILMAGGHHLLQLHQRAGMAALWKDCVEALANAGDRLATPWGVLAFGEALATTADRLAWLAEHPGESDLAPLWGLPRPGWELS